MMYPAAYLADEPVPFTEQMGVPRSATGHMGNTLDRLRW